MSVANDKGLKGLKGFKGFKALWLGAAILLLGALAGVYARQSWREARRLAAEKAPEESGGFRLHTRDYLLVAGGAVLIALLGYLGVHGLTRHVGRYEKRWKDKYNGMMRK